jgi:haloalkane dehalogenase
MNYVDEGQSSETLLLVHGNPTWSFYWRELIAKKKDSHRVVAPDHIGMGLSDRPQDYAYRLDQHIDNLESLVLALDLKNITLVVHDWGGAIGMGVALKHPERFKSFVITNTAAFTDEHIPWRIGVCKNPVGEWAIRKFNAFAWPATFMAVERPLTPLIKKGYLFPYGNYQDRIATAKFVRDIPMNKTHPSFQTLNQIGKALPGLIRPTTFVWGMKDFCFTPHFLRRWQQTYPHAKSIELTKVGHYVMEDAPEAVLAALSEM